MSFFWTVFGLRGHISQEVRDFPTARKSLYDLLCSWSKCLADPEDDCVRHVCTLMGGLGASFEEVVGNVGYEEGATPGECFAQKCHVLSEVMLEICELLENYPELRDQGAEVVQMISLHVGRLTVNAYDTEDTFALRMDHAVGVWERGFRIRETEEDPELEYQKEELYKIWQRMYQVSPKCFCLQCGKRSVLGAL